MFDDIIIRRPDLLPGLRADELKHLPEAGLYCQTKDFDCAMDVYEIREDLTVWLDERGDRYVDPEPDELGLRKHWYDKFGWKQVFSTHARGNYLNFYTSRGPLGSKEYRWLEWQCQIGSDGKLTNITFINTR